MNLQIICNHCDEKFYKEKKLVNQNIKRGHKFYCSKRCYQEARNSSITVPCFTCGKPKSVQHSKLAKSKSGKHFCSSSCAAKENNKGMQRMFKHGLGIYREKALKHYPPKCRICDYGIVKVLEVHHKDKNRKNNNIENLDVLCPTHHMEYHRGIRKY